MSNVNKFKKFYAKSKVTTLVYICLSALHVNLNYAGVRGVI